MVLDGVCGQYHTPRPLYVTERDLVLNVQEAGWAPWFVWTALERRKRLSSTVIRTVDLKGTRTVQAYSVSDADSESRHKECPLFISAGAYSGGR